MSFSLTRRILGFSLIGLAAVVIATPTARAASNGKRALGNFSGTYKGVWKAAGSLPLTLRMPKGRGNGAGTFEATPCKAGDGVSPLKLRITKYKVRRNGKKLISTGKATWERGKVPALIGPNLSGNLKIVAVLRGKNAAARGSLTTGTLSGSLAIAQGGKLPAAVCVVKAFALPTTLGPPFPGEIAIPDDSTTVFSLFVPNSVTVITDLDVAISIGSATGVSPFNSDYNVSLRHMPSGIQIELFTGIGFNDDGIFVRLDDDAATDIGAVPDDANDFPVIGVFNTEDTLLTDFLLSSFNGVLASGEWQLIVEDDSPGLTGALLNWTLHIE